MSVPHSPDLAPQRRSARPAWAPVTLSIWLLCAGLTVTACARPAAIPAPPPTLTFNALPRADFNRRAAELALPLFWRDDADGDGAVDAEEVATLWGIPGGSGDYLAEGQLTAQFAAAYARMRSPDDTSGLSPSEARRREAVRRELSQGRPTLVETDLRGASAEERALVDNLLAAASIIEALYARQVGTLQYRQEVPEGDRASQMLLYRNQGPFCQAPKTETDPDCRGVPERPRRISGLYPPEIQSGEDTGFCVALEARADADELLSPFTVVAMKAHGDLEAIPYSVAYGAEMAEIAAHLRAAERAIRDPGEAALRRYLSAAADSFESNDWRPADEAWSRMTSANSRWYLRIGPDEVQDEPCWRKALFHMSFARINPDGVEWQTKLGPLKSQMEEALAMLAGPPYEPQDVTFHLPDFIDIVLNAGDSRAPLGATVGQSLPNWGPVANEGRGRTVAMVNLYTDADSEASWRVTQSSLFCPQTMERTAFDPHLTIMSTVLHEAAHNLGPSHEYAVGGQTDAALFGGALAAMLEELKAQTSASYLSGWLVQRGVIDAPTADAALLADVSWAFGEISSGMYDAEGKPRAYSQLAAIQMGYLMSQGGLSWRADEHAANGSDPGCFDVDLVRARAAMAQLEARVLQIKATGDKAGAEALIAAYVDADDAWAEAREQIRERALRAPTASFVYSIRW